MIWGEKLLPLQVNSIKFNNENALVEKVAYCTQLDYSVLLLYSQYSSQYILSKLIGIISAITCVFFK